MDKRGGRNGSEKRVTVNDIARSVSVSNATVSLVLSGDAPGRVSPKTRAAVLAAAEELGYTRNRLAVALKSGRTHTVAIACPVALAGVSDLRGSFYIKDLSVALMLAGAERGLGTLGCFSTPDSMADPRELAERRVDGVVVLNGDPAPEWIRALVDTRLPIVEIGTAFGPHQVHADNHGGAESAMAHLYALGHRRIAHLAGPMHVRSALDRFRGYDSFCQEAGLDPLVQSIGEPLDMLMDSPYRPTALFAYDDVAAMSAVGDARRHGLRVPDDLSVVGFNDDVRAEAFSPALTTVSLPLDGMARAALEMLESLLADGDPSPQTQFVPTALVVRDTTGPAVAVDGLAPIP